MNEEKNPGELLSQLYLIQIRHHQFESSYSDYINMIIHGVCEIWKKGQVLVFFHKNVVPDRIKHLLKVE